MPLYTSYCKHCKFTTEIFSQTQMDFQENAPECPLCGRKMIRRFSRNTSFILKGRGWAKDKYTKPTGEKNDS